MQIGKPKRMAYYDSNQRSFTQKETTKHPSSMLHSPFKKKAQIIKHNKKKTKLWAEDDSYLDEMKGMQKIWREYTLRWLDAAAKMDASWVLSDEALNFLKKMGVKSDFTPYLSYCLHWLAQAS